MNKFDKLFGLDSYPANSRMRILVDALYSIGIYESFIDHKSYWETGWFNYCGKIIYISCARINNWFIVKGLDESIYEGDNVENLTKKLKNLR